MEVFLLSNSIHYSTDIIEVYLSHKVSIIKILNLIEFWEKAFKFGAYAQIWAYGLKLITYPFFDFTGCKL